MTQKYENRHKSVKKLLMILDYFQLIYKMKYQNINFIFDVLQYQVKFQSKNGININKKSGICYNSKKFMPFHLFIHICQRNY